MKLKIEIEILNDATLSPLNLATLLHEVGSDLQNLYNHTNMRPDNRPIMDANGNTVGHWKITAR